METTTYVAGFMFSEDLERVALIRKLKPEWQRNKLNGIGGKVEKGEKPLVAMNREFCEETGYEERVDWKEFAVLAGVGFTVNMFAVRGPVEQLASRELEKIEVISTRDVRITGDGMIENTPWLLGLALDFLMDGRPKFAVVQYPL